MTGHDDDLLGGGFDLDGAGVPFCPVCGDDLTSGACLRCAPTPTPKAKKPLVGELVDRLDLPPAEPGKVMGWARDNPGWATVIAVYLGGLALAALTVVAVVALLVLLVAGLFRMALAYRQRRAPVKMPKHPVAELPPPPSTSSTAAHGLPDWMAGIAELFTTDTDTDTEPGANQ